MTKKDRRGTKERMVCAGDILQVRYSASENWMDFCTICSEEIDTAIAKVRNGIHEINREGLRAEFRIVRKFMGVDVIRGSRV